MKIIAHRGASGYHPEMTQDAYEKAFALGADGVECDIQLTADGVAVCLHDPMVDRTSDGTGAVNSKTLAELRELNFGTAERPQRILTLAELLELVKDAPRPDYRPEIFVETKRLDT
ncbi:MAG TPA: glycerophosphodiester phosphodiesterase, partial [Corynebacterium variabile]|nr:glycerophosphodiester phosphodiesterase [Corynebacterium variabile]